MSASRSGTQITLFSVALMDSTCPPSTVYAAYHMYAGPRQIEGASVGLAHVIGLGQACGLHILEKAAA